MTNNYVVRWNVIRMQIIIEKVNKTIRKTKEFNQWTSTEEVLKWYKNLEKNKYKLINFDIKDFYPSITKTLRQNTCITK